MKRKQFMILWLIGVFLLQSCSPAPQITPDVSEKVSPAATESALTTETDVAEYSRYVSEVISALTAWPDRYTGSEANAAAADYVAGQMNAAGLLPYAGDTYLQPYRQFVNGEEAMPNNVVGILKGTGNPAAEAVVISCHFDTVNHTPGAVDNASGVAAMLCTAGLLVSMETANRPDLIFCAFNGEEQFYIGSQAFVGSFTDQYESVYNINYDCVGMKDGGTYMMGAAEEDLSFRLVSDLGGFLEKSGLSLNSYSNKDVRSDHVSFLEAGVPGVCLTTDNIFTVIHSPKDTSDKIDPEAVAGLASVVTEFLARDWAGETDNGTGKENQDEIRY